jgi:hypothetical protein
LKKRRKISTYFRSLEWTKWSRGVLSFFRDSRASRKSHPLRACCDTPEESRLAIECEEILFWREAILGLNSEDASSSPKDDGLDEVNEAILLALSDEPFSYIPSVRQMAHRTRVSKSIVYRRLVNFLHFTVRHQTSSLGFSRALRQSEVISSRAELSIRLRDLLLFIRHQE